MSKEMTILVLSMMSVAVCVPFFLMAIVWLKTGISPYGQVAQPAVESEVQKMAVAELQALSAAPAQRLIS